MCHVGLLVSYLHEGAVTMIHDSWPYRVIRSLGIFFILYMAIAFIVSIVAVFVYGGVWPLVSMAVSAAIFAALLWALMQSGRTAKTEKQH